MNHDRVKYWLELADDDADTAKWLLKGNRLLHCGYFCHQVVEKAFKAMVASKSNESVPKIHDLPKLADLGGFWDLLSDEQQQAVDKLIPLQIEARYPEHKEKLSERLTAEFCEGLIIEAEGLLCWTKQQLEK